MQIPCQREARTGSKNTAPNRSGFAPNAIGRPGTGARTGPRPSPCRSTDRRTTAFRCAAQYQRLTRGWHGTCIGPIRDQHRPDFAPQNALRALDGSRNVETSGTATTTRERTDGRTAHRARGPWSDGTYRSALVARRPDTLRPRRAVGPSKGRRAARPTANANENHSHLDRPRTALCAAKSDRPGGLGRVGAGLLLLSPCCPSRGPRERVPSVPPALSAYGVKSRTCEFKRKSAWLRFLGRS
jgi:hypothetical protein